MSIFMRSFWILSTTFAFTVYAASVTGEEFSQHATASALNMVQQALRAEASGDLELRAKLVASIDADSATADGQWLLGNLRDGKGTWKSIAASIECLAQDPKLREYEEKRSRLEENAEDHIELAKWCQGARLAEQRRAHLLHVLRLDPENLYAHQALGHRRSGWEWIAPEQLKQAEERAKSIKNSLREYGAVMQTIVRELGSSKLTLVARAEKRLMAIQAERAIPAMESAFSDADDRALEAGMHWLGRHSDPQASLALARFAIFHPSTFVQQLACSQLAKRDLYEFAPTLVDWVTSPVHSSLQPLFDPNGSLLGFQHAFSREGLERDQILVIETAINGVSRRAPLGRSNVEVRGVRQINNRATATAALEAVQRTQETAAEREQRVASRNQQTRILNDRVAAVVSQIAGRTISSEPKELWNWWYELNESERPPIRTSKYVRLYDQSNYEIASTPVRAFSAECFAGGTLVTTQRGLKAIDALVSGDLVLSKQISTGELAWKPVLEATRRTPSALLVIDLGPDQLKCTPGHVFWVSGKGWRKASQLRIGDVLNAAKQPVAIDRISNGTNEETFNLIVADHANYFVGVQQILSHDFTSRTHTREVVPGYRESAPGYAE